MKLHLPSSTTLLVFIMVFKLRSFNKAAVKLHMTPPAVSYQIKNLEDILGQQLFVRSAQGVVPTPFAESIYFDASAALEHLQGIVERSQPQHQGAPVRILATQAFSSLWLLPKMPDLLKRFRDTQFEIIGWSGGFNPRENGQSPNNFDIEFRYAAPGDLVPNEDARLIAQDIAIPVCTPDYQSSVLQQDGLDACDSLTVIHARNWPGMWDQWCAGAYNQPVHAERELYFQSTSLCVQAVLSGIGIAIVHAPLVAEDIRAHRLVRPHSFQLQMKEGYFVVLHGLNGRHASFFQEFVDWCREQMDLDTSAAALPSISSTICNNPLLPP
ncbi:LysR family transcriptional regulator [Alcaligenaceae bacterium CGII-47]|nr:LysR family transcriptional regulator [Alcaligenaceae bacterium CGII-47]